MSSPDCSTQTNVNSFDIVWGSRGDGCMDVPFTGGGPGVIHKGRPVGLLLRVVGPVRSRTRGSDGSRVGGDDGAEILVGEAEVAAEVGGGDPAPTGLPSKP